MSSFRVQLGAWAIVALVLLRLAIGWHFYQEGTQKLAYDAGEGRLRIVFSAESFLRQATGPFAGLFHAQVPTDWSAQLAIAVQDTPQRQGERAAALAEYQQHRMAAKNGTVLLAPRDAPWLDYQSHVDSQWKVVLTRVQSIPGLTAEQVEVAARQYVIRQQQLVDYLVTQTDAIADYQHETWRLSELDATPGSTEIPYMQARIAAKTAELRATVQPWLDETRRIKAAYFKDLRNILTAEQRADAATAKALDAALADPRQNWLSFVNLSVTVLTVGVGVCLLLGLCTRLASLVGALFLLAVMATQPPWASGAVTMFFPYQLVEFVGLLVLFAVGAGRWAGLDYLAYASWSKLRRRISN